MPTQRLQIKVGDILAFTPNKLRAKWILKYLQPNQTYQVMSLHGPSVGFNSKNKYNISLSRYLVEKHFTNKTEHDKKFKKELEEICR